MAVVKAPSPNGTLERANELVEKVNSIKRDRPLPSNLKEAIRKHNAKVSLNNRVEVVRVAVVLGGEAVPAEDRDHSRTIKRTVKRR